MNLIYDFETLGQNASKAPVLSLAMLSFDTDRMISDYNTYSYEELVDTSLYYKFDVEEQVKKYSRVIETDTLLWWNKQGTEAKRVLKPSSEDISVSRLYEIMKSVCDVDRVYTRGCGFDTTLMSSIIASTGKTDPTKWWTIRDTRSFIEGMLVGATDIRNDFVPKSVADQFVKHDPRHDIAMDVIRIQYLTRIVYDKEV